MRAPQMVQVVSPDSGDGKAGKEPPGSSWRNESVLLHRTNDMQRRIVRSKDCQYWVETNLSWIRKPRQNRSTRSRPACRINVYLKLQTTGKQGSK